MKYSTRQQTYAQYLLRQIGFQEQKDIDLYLRQLLLVKGRYHYQPKAKNPFKRWHYSAKECVDALVKEVELKKKPDNISWRKLPVAYFNATNLARYVFCPAALSIGNSFNADLPNESDALLALGEHLHSKLRLSQQRWGYQQGPIDPFYQRAWQNPAIAKILSAQEIYSGHAAQAHPFHNTTRGFVGSPDYIFQDRQGAYFVVEEKFIRYDDPMNPSAYQICREEWAGTSAVKSQERQEAWSKIPCFFYKNHLLQVLAYLYNIEEYPLDYGYLVYWLYDFREGNPYVHKACVKKLSLDAKHQLLYDTYLRRFQNFAEKGVETFDPQVVNPKKCAACSFNAYCMHKTRRYSEVHYPYRSSDIGIFAAKFPAELRHQI